MCTRVAHSQTQTPLHGHYPPGQSGIRGAVTPEPGSAYTNFSRFFSNLEVKDASGASAQSDLDDYVAHRNPVTA